MRHYREQLLAPGAWKLAALSAAITVGVFFGLSTARGPEGTLADTSLDAEEQAFLSQINNYRAEHELPPLIIDPSLQEAAEWMSVDMGVQGYFSHTDSLGRSPWDRICDFGYCYNTWMGENIAAGYVTGSSVFQGWRDSPGHNANMLGEYYRVMGLARVHTPGSTFGWYWTNDFGGHIAEASPPPAPTDTLTPTPSAAEDSETVGPTPTPTETPTRTPTPTPVVTPVLEPGDVDCNSVVDGGDSLQILFFLAELANEPSGDCPAVGGEGGTASHTHGEHPHGDLTCDGRVDVSDAVAVLHALATGSELSSCPA